MSDDQTRERVRRIRIEKGFSQADLSCRTGIHRSTLCQLEKGYIRVWPGHLARIARALGVSVSELKGAA